MLHQIYISRHTHRDYLSSPINLFHEDKSAARVSYRTLSILLLRFTGCRVRCITGSICYRQNSRIQSLFVFWQISLWIRFDNQAIRHRLLADSQMNEFVVNRRADTSTRKSSVVEMHLYQSFWTVSLSLHIAPNQIGKYFRKDTVASERASKRMRERGRLSDRVICRANGVPIKCYTIINTENKMKMIYNKASSVAVNIPGKIAPG